MPDSEFRSRRGSSPKTLALGFGCQRSLFGLAAAIPTITGRLRRTRTTLSALPHNWRAVGAVMDGVRVPITQPTRTAKKKIANSPALALALQRYYQLECTRPTSARLQIWLDELLRKADAKTALDHRAQSIGDH